MSMSDGNEATRKLREGEHACLTCNGLGIVRDASGLTSRECKKCHGSGIVP